MKSPPTTAARRLTKEISQVQVSYIINHQDTPPLLCLHGFGASTYSFHQLFQRLHNRTLIAYDAPAFGRTERPSHTTYYTPTFSAKIAKTLLHPYPNYAILAHSMGALAAARLENMSHLILIAPALLPRTLAQNLLPLRLLTASLTSLSAFLLSCFIPLLKPLLTITLSRQQFWKNALTLSRHPTNPPTDAVIHGYTQVLQNPGWEKGLLRFSVAALKDRGRALKRGEDFVEQLKRRNCKILIIHGEDDAIVPLDNSVRLAERLNTKLVVLERCGHVPHEECPDIVAEHINSFLNAS